MTSTEQNFLDLMKQISAYSEAISLIHWDLRTHIPQKGWNNDQKRSVYYQKK